MPPTVLIAEDDGAIRDLLKAVLSRSGYESVLAINGAEALREIATRRIDLVLLDLIMPTVSGFDLLRHLHETAPDMLERFIVITAASGRVVDECPELGLVHCVLRKPLDIDQLVSEMAVALDGRREPATGKNGKRGEVAGPHQERSLPSGDGGPAKLPERQRFS